MRFLLPHLVVSFAVILWAGAAPAAEMSEEEAIKNALSAAPEAVAKNASVMLFGENGEMKTVKQGTNGFTCMPDNPQSPGNDPMCLDANGMEWAHAWMTKTQPPVGKIGFAYMLQGGSDATNTDSFATGPAEGGEWAYTGPHVMILNVKDAI